MAILMAFIFGQTYNFDYSLDDNLIQESIPSIENGISGVKTIFTSRYNKSDYRPVTLSTFYIEQLIFGENNASTSHIINVILYFLLVVAIWFLLSQIIRKEKTKNSFLIFGITLLFLVHPIHANVVANIKCRDNLLSAFFLILVLISVFRMINNGFKWYLALLVVIMFLAGMYSKQDTIGTVLLVPLSILLFSNSKITFNKRNIRIAIALGFSILIVTIISYSLGNSLAPIDDAKSVSYVKFNENPIIENWNLQQRIYALFSTFYIYLKMFIYPKGYYYYFGYNLFDFPLKTIYIVISAATFIAAIITAFYHWNKRKLLTFGIFFMGINLIYCLNFFVAVAGIVAARYAFIASLGFCIVVVCALDFIKNYKLKYLLLTLLIGTFTYFSTQRVSDWKNLTTLIDADIPHLKNSHEANRIAASLYLNKTENLTDNDTENKVNLGKALQYIQQANEIYGFNHVTHDIEGMIRFKQNDLDNSIVAFQKSIAVDTGFQESTYELLGDAYYMENKLHLARTYYTKLYEHNNRRQDIINKISTTYFEEGNTQALLMYNDSLINSAPSLFAPYENLAYFYLFETDTIKSNFYFNEAVKRAINPEQLEDMKNSYNQMFE